MVNKGSLFEHVAILGLGLMGGSLGLALQEAGGARVVAGYDAAPGVAERARERGAVDVACASVADAVTGADLVVLAAPVAENMRMLPEVASYLAAEAVVTDLGSTKAAMLAASEGELPYPRRFVGGHPMTGSERSGIAAADVGLYRGCVWCLTPTPGTEPAALARVTALIKRLGAQPLLMDAEAHDAAVAAISHLPLVAAAALVHAVSASPAWPLAQRLASGGFRDTTRVASGDPHMARDICLTNAQPLVACLDAYIAVLNRMRDQIARQDPHIGGVFADAKVARDAWAAQANSAG